MSETREELLARLEGQANQIRRNIWRSLRASGGGHAGGSLSAADMLAALYFHTMKIKPDEPDWPDRDRFILSKGHANCALGAVLAQAGFIEDSVLDQFYGYESLFGMHPDIKMAGVEMSTGGLGHGLPVGVGMALGARIKGKSFQTYVMIGDGELDEGSNWEAAMAAAHHRLNNLTAIVDVNRVQQSGHVAEIMGLGSLSDKWRAFGWELFEFDGHDMGEIVDAFGKLPLSRTKPSALLAHTTKGKGVSFAEDTYVWHSNNVDDEILAKALAELEAPAGAGGR